MFVRSKGNGLSQYNEQAEWVHITFLDSDGGRWEIEVKHTDDIVDINMRQPDAETWDNVESIVLS